jgi:hypothetical protein
LLRQAGEHATIEYLGVQDWRWQGEGYIVEQNYRLKTPEGTFDLRLPVWGGESRQPQNEDEGQEEKKEYQGKRWHVVFAEPLAVQPQSWTPLGTRMQGVRQSAARFVQEWGDKLSRGSAEQAYLETRPPGPRVDLPARSAAGLLVLSLGLGTTPAGFLTAGAALAKPDRGRQLFLPGFAGFVEGKLLEHKDMQYASDQARKAIEMHLPDLFDPKPGSPLITLRVPVLPTPFDASWRLESNALYLAQPVEIVIAGKYVVEGTAEVVARDPILVRELQSMLDAFQQGGSDSRQPVASQPTWQLVGLSLTLGYDQGSGR